MQMINFMKNLCMAGGFLQLAAYGAGRLSVDRR
jgi:putative oxidoreductase